MRGIRIIVLGLIATMVVLGGTSTSSAHRKPAAPPDTYVTNWDAVASQAFTAAGLSPAEGRGSSLRRGRGLRLRDGDRGRVPALRCRRRRTVDRFGSSRGGRCGASHAGALPTGSGARDPRPGVYGVAGHGARRHGENGRDRRRQGGGQLVHRRAGRGRLPGIGDVQAAEPADPRRLAPDRGHAADRDLPGADASVQPPFADQFRPDGPPALSSSKWAREYNEVKEIGSSTSATRTPSRPWPHDSGASRRCSRHTAASASSCSTTNWMSWTRPGSWRWSRSPTPTQSSPASTPSTTTRSGGPSRQSAPATRTATRRR